MNNSTHRMQGLLSNLFLCFEANIRRFSLLLMLTLLLLTESFTIYSVRPQIRSTFKRSRCDHHWIKYITSGRSLTYQSDIDNNKILSSLSSSVQEQNENNNNNTPIIPTTSASQSDIGRQQTISNTMTTEGGHHDDENNDNENDIKSWRSLLEVSNAKSRKIRGSNYVQLATVDPITNEPRCRTIVFRGFLSNHDSNDEVNNIIWKDSCSTLDGMSCIMKMITDQNSEKVKEICNHHDQSDNVGTTMIRNQKKTCSNAELVWWFPKTSEQYRIRGTIIFIGGGQHPMDTKSDMIIARKSQWGNLSDSAREGFYYDNKNHMPGTVYCHPNDNNNNNNNNNKVFVPPVGGRDVDGNVIQPPPDNFLLMLLIPQYCDYVRLTNMYRQIDHYDDQLNEWKSNRVNP